MMAQKLMPQNFGFLILQASVLWAVAQSDCQWPRYS